jgi:hypothetical protein
LMSRGIPYDGASAYEVETIKKVQRTNAANLTNDVLTVLFTIFSFCLVSDRIAWGRNDVDLASPRRKRGSEECEKPCWIPVFA